MKKGFEKIYEKGSRIAFTHKETVETPAFTKERTVRLIGTTVAVGGIATAIVLSLMIDSIIVSS